MPFAQPADYDNPKNPTLYKHAESLNDSHGVDEVKTHQSFKLDVMFYVTKSDSQNH